MIDARFADTGPMESREGYESRSNEKVKQKAKCRAGLTKGWVT